MLNEKHCSLIVPQREYFRKNYVMNDTHSHHSSWKETTQHRYKPTIIHS